MANKEIDLSKLKDEINTRKQTKTDAPEKSGNMAKDEFLNGLVESLNTGKPTQSSDKLRKVDVKASEKTGDDLSSGSNSTVGSELNKYSNNINESSNPTPSKSKDEMYGERDDKLYEEFERKKKQMLNNRSTSTSQNNSPQQQQSNQFISEDKLNEKVNNIISDKFAMVVEQAMKDSIVEIYTSARMKEVLDDNRDTIKKIVIEVIKELQNRKK